MKIGIAAYFKNRFRKMSLVGQFSAAVVFLIFMVMVMVNALIITHQKGALRSEINSNHLVIANKLAKDVIAPLIFMDPLNLDELVKSTAQTPACSYACVIDKNKRIVAHTDRKFLGQVPAAEELTQFAGVMSVGGEQLHDVNGSDITEIIVPVKAGYDVVGAVAVGFSRDEIDAVIGDNLSGLEKYIFLISFVVMAGGIWGAYGLARWLATPMKKLKDSMELVHAGNLDVELPNGNLLDCSQVLGCKTTECPAYGRQRCWDIPGTRRCGYVQADIDEKMNDCKKCRVYMEACGGEIGELVEGFNQMVRKLRVSIKQLEESNKEKARLEKFSALGEMAMTVAHEIKNPLNAILGAASYLQDNFEGEVLREFLSIIEEETKRLNEIVTSILRYSRPVPLKPQVSDINKTVCDTIELIRQEARENNIEVVATTDERIPMFKFDAQQMKQAFLNILVNSLDATKAGDVIKITTSTLNSNVIVKIHDTGMGMSKEAICEIFKPFYTTKTRGSGLGLACVERIVKDHKGSITVRSETGGGAEFAITLPLWS